MTLHVTHMYNNRHITHTYAFQSETSAFVGRARKEKKVQAGCIYASNYIIPFVEIRGGGSIPTGACVACLPALLPRAPWSPLTPLSFSVENPQRPKEEKKKKKRNIL